MKNNLKPRPSEMIERLNFKKVEEKASEPIADFAARLKKCSLKCNYEENLSKTFKDQSICGLRDYRTEKALFKKEELTSYDAYKEATVQEPAEKMHRTQERKIKDRKKKSLG